MYQDGRGHPAGGPLSSILANIYLDRFDKLMEKRGYRFVRYADDIVIFVQTFRVTERAKNPTSDSTKGSVKVNHEKSRFGPIISMKFIDFKLYS